MELDEYGPISESIGVALDGPMNHRGKVFWSKADGSVTCGFWEVDSGRFSCAFDGEGEMVHVVKGTIIATSRIRAKSSSSARAISSPSHPAGPASGRCRRRCASSSRPLPSSEDYGSAGSASANANERDKFLIGFDQLAYARNAIDSTRPSAGASQTISIFIAERVTRGWPRSTRSPVCDMDPEDAGRKGRAHAAIAGSGVARQTA